MFNMKKLMCKVCCALLVFSMTAYPVKAAEVETAKTADSSVVNKGKQSEEGMSEDFGDVETGAETETNDDEINETESQANHSEIRETEIESNDDKMGETEKSNETSKKTVSEEKDAAPLSGESNEITIVSQDNEQGTLVLRMANPKLEDEKSTIVVPTWTEKNGQDDIIWYEAEKKDDGWYVIIEAEEHNFESGIYNMHFYAKDSKGNLTLLKGMKVDLQTSVTPAVEAVQEDNIVTITFKNALNVSENSEVYFPVWGAKDGQNDIIWYKAEYKGAGKWQAIVNLSQHKETGKYNVHVYANKNNGMNFVMASSFNVSDATSATVSVESKDDQNGTFRVKITDVKTAAGVDRILVPVWSSKDGQDDIIWYEAVKNGNIWYVDVDSENHKGDTGKYNVHVYIFDKLGNSTLAAHMTTDVQRDVRTRLEITKNQQQTEITVMLYNYRTSGAVRFAVWGSLNGQNDIVWYEPEQVGKNTWKATIKVADHKETGKYNIHVYEMNGMQLVDHGQCEIEGITSGKIEVLDAAGASGTICLRVEGVSAPSGISQIQAAVWTQKNGQDDLKWYTAEKRNDGYYIYIPKSEHNNENGKYIVHAYAYDNNGSSKLAAYIDFEVSDSDTYSCDGVYITDVDTKAGKFKATAKNLKTTSEVKSVKIAVWTQWLQQKDLKWYDAVKIGNDWYVDIDTTKDYNSHKGIYIAHAYYYNYNDEAFLLGGTQILMPWNLLGSAGVDVSLWNDQIDWDRVKNTGIDYAMIRSGYGWDKTGQQTDSLFYNNITGAKKSGIKVGVYHYSYSDNVEDAIAEADYCLNIIRKAGVPLDYPIAFDYENATDIVDKDGNVITKGYRDEAHGGSMTKRENTDVIKAFCDRIQAAGYQCVVYGNPDLFNNYVYYDEIKSYGIWLAYWTYNPEGGYGDFENVKIWQYSNEGSMDGINGRVDLNVSFLR